MGAAILATLYSRLGEMDKAYELFTDSYRPNEVPPFGVLAETAGGTNPYFATGAGGMLQSVLFGFGGLEITAGRHRTTTGSATRRLEQPYHHRGRAGTSYIQRKMIDRDQLATMLARQIELTRTKIAGYEQASAPVTPDDAIGRVSPHGRHQQQKRRGGPALRTARSKLDRLLLMQDNLDDPNLGLCRRCGREIPVGRVLLLPESPYCVRCA